MSDTTQKYEFSKDFDRGDMTHRGPFDFYQRCEEEIREAINSGLPFDTGWRGCKHEILSSRVCRVEDGSFCCEVSVSDDFDTPGIGREGLVPPPDSSFDDLWELLENAMDTAHHEAELDRKGNEDYRGFQILVRSRRKTRRLRYWQRGYRRRVGRSERPLQWVETYILDISMWGLDHPPGDSYHEWGFQGEDVIPLNVREELEDYARSYVPGKSPKQFTCKRWTIRPWDI